MGSPIKAPLKYKGIKRNKIILPNRIVVVGHAYKRLLRTTETSWATKAATSLCVWGGGEKGRERRGRKRKLMRKAAVIKRGRLSHISLDSGGRGTVGLLIGLRKAKSNPTLCTLSFPCLSSSFFLHT